MADNASKQVVGLIMVQKAKIVEVDGQDVVRWKAHPKHTQGHAESLRTLGYTVLDELHQTSKGKFIQVVGSEFVTVKIDTTKPKEALETLKEVIRKKQLISYPSKEGTQIIFQGSDGERNDGSASRMPSAVGRLDRLQVKANGREFGLSCLVAKSKSNSARTSTAKVEETFSLGDLLD